MSPPTERDGGRTFPLGVILTGTTGKMLSRSGFGAFQEMAEYMTGGPVWTHELVALGPVLKAELLRQHPALPSIADVGRDDWSEWLSVEESKHGAALSVTPIPDYARTADPISTLDAMLAAREDTTDDE